MEENIVKLEDYNIILKKDCYESNSISVIILLNKKHTTDEFQEELNKAKEKAYEDIQEYGDDWYFIQKYINKEIDYIELGINGYVEF